MVWTKYNINKWCLNFIVQKKRLPNLEDLKEEESPNLTDIYAYFSDLNDLINNCGHLPYTYKYIKDGFEKFFNINGFYPTALEIDKFSYLPTSRSIQRTWGGLENLRNILGLKITNYTKGETRSIKAGEIWERGMNIEDKIEKLLQGIFGEVFVHSQKRFNNARVDFYVYSKDIIFAIDVFYFENKHHLLGVINEKQKRYINLPHSIIFLGINDNFSQKQIDLIIKNKKNKLPKHQNTMNYDHFCDWIRTLKPLDSPIINSS